MSFLMPPSVRRFYGRAEKVSDIFRKQNGPRRNIVFRLTRVADAGPRRGTRRCHDGAPQVVRFCVAGAAIYWSIDWKSCFDPHAIGTGQILSQEKRGPVPA
jgi:hypothetical protein